MAAREKKPEKNETKAGSTRSPGVDAKKQLARSQTPLLKGQMEKALKERMKELNCFYSISTMMEMPDIPLDEILGKSFHSSHQPVSFQRLPKPALYWKEKPTRHQTSEKHPICSSMTLS